MATKGFIKTFSGERLLPITRGELVLDQDGNIALTSLYFEVGKNNNNYGLISASELNAIRASLGLGSTGSQGNSLTDVYTKLSHINSGLSVNNIPLKFYDDTTGAIKTNIVSDNDSIQIGLANNVLSLRLNEIHSEILNNTTTNQIIKGITVDKYGRVTTVTQSELNNNEIPSTLSKKLLSESTASDIPNGSTDGTLIANKNYVDSQISNLGTNITGSLKFIGTLGSETEANNALSMPKGSFYKINKGFEYPQNKLYGHSASTEIQQLYVGDTLIVYDTNSYVYIPSGDDDTLLHLYISGYQTSTGNITSIINSLVNSIKLEFDKPFLLSNTAGSLNIKLPKASSTESGYLSKEDYTRFNNLVVSSEQKNVSYEPNITSGYLIGTLNINGNPNYIYGKQYNLLLENNELKLDNDTIKFESTNGGLSISSNDGKLLFTSNYTIDPDSNNYLELTNSSILGIKLGEFNNDSTIKNPGLVDTSMLQNFIYKFNTHFEIISGSLTSTNPDLADSKYQYNNDALKNAVNVNI